MKCVLIFSVFVAIVLAEVDQQRLEYMMHCSLENGFDMTLIANKEAIEKMKDDPKFRCFMKCVMNKSGMISETGKLNEEKVKNNVAATPLSADDLKRIKECADKQKQEDMCERIAEMAECIYEVSEKKQ